MKKAEDETTVYAEVKIDEETGLGFCIARDKFYNEAGLSVYASHPIGEGDFIEALRSFLLLYDSDSIDVSEVFDKAPAENIEH